MGIWTISLKKQRKTLLLLHSHIYSSSTTVCLTGNVDMEGSLRCKLEEIFNKHYNIAHCVSCWGIGSLL